LAKPIEELINDLREKTSKIAMERTYRVKSQERIQSDSSSGISRVAVMG